MFDLNKKDPVRSGAEQPVAPGRNAQPAGGGYAASSTVGRPAGVAVIGRSIQIVGDLRGDEDLCIEGDIQGGIHLPNHSLTIGVEGRIHADVYAKSVVIDGEIHGDIYGSERVTVRANARVTGNIVAARVSLEEGARFEGSIDMDPQSLKTALEKVQPATQGSPQTRGAAGRANGSAATGAPSIDRTATQSEAPKGAKTDPTL
jgi:cytoskeletal protein CcmA (bactofilin family)